MKVGQGLHRGHPIPLTIEGIRPFERSLFGTLLYAVGYGYSLVAVEGVLTLIVVGPQPLRAVKAHWG
jgi:hypothetical protein